MSTLIQSACWKITGITATQKLVLISLADQANDDGVCWPSVKLMTVRTCLSERAVQAAVASLINLGLLERHERPGRSSYFTVTPAGYAPPQDVHPAPYAPLPRTICTPPPQEVHPTPAGGAPITINEPQVEPQGSLQLAPPAPQGGAPGPKDPSCATYATWKAYADAYMARYGVWPIWNGSVAGKVSQIVKRLGAAEAPQVAAFYLTVNDAIIVRQQHAIGPLLAGCESMRTQWATGRAMTGAKARQQERTSSNLDAAQEAIRIIKERGEARNA